MPTSNLPERPSLEYLKRLARERLRLLRTAEPGARLSKAQLEIAREHGFSSWRALKLEIERRRESLVDVFFSACLAGDVAAIVKILGSNPGLVGERDREGATCLHKAIAHPEALRLLISRGADPNARDVGDNALPLHFAAGGGHLASARVLLDAGSDVHGVGDFHLLEPIGWATVWDEPHRDMVDLLVERGARHHVFSAIALGDRNLLRRIVDDDFTALRRRLSRHEQGQSALHYVVAPPDGLVGGAFRTGDHYATLELLISMGAELEAKDAKGRTALEIAMLRGDEEAARILHSAGAKVPAASRRSSATQPASFGDSVGTIRPMLAVRDMRTSIAWYQAVGFQLRASHEDNGRVDWAAVVFGRTEIMLVPSIQPTSALSLWVSSDRLDDLFTALKERQLERSRAVLAGLPAPYPEVRFTADLHTAFYGQREFAIVDPDGIVLYFTDAPV